MKSPGLWERIIPRLARRGIAVVAPGILPSRDIRTSVCIRNRSHDLAANSVNTRLLWERIIPRLARQNIAV